MKPTRILFLMACLAWPILSFANPVLEAAQRIGFDGLSSKAAPKDSPTNFKPSGKRPTVQQIVEAFVEEADDRKTMASGINQVIDSYEEALKGSGYENDASTALAFAFLTLNTVVTGKEVEEEAYTEVANQMRASLDRPEVRRASDAEKQAAYETALAQTVFVLLLGNSGNEADKAKIGQLADAMLTNLFNTTAAEITLRGAKASVKVKALPKPVTQTQATTPAVTSGAFSYSVPQGWKEKDGWITAEIFDDPTAKDAVRIIQVKVLPAIKPGGNIGDVLRSIWDSALPPEGKGKFSSMVYRRYVGDGVPAFFIAGSFRQASHDIDYSYTLMLVDAGDTWHPIVLGITYNDSWNIRGGVQAMALTMLPKTAFDMEQFFATIRAPKTRGNPLTTREAIAGSYKFGSGAGLDMINLNTGATSMSYVTYGGTLNLTADGKFTYTFVSASGNTGSAMRVRSAKGKGTFTIQGDILICTFTEYDQGDGYKVKENRYRIAGMTAFSTGERIVVLVDKLDMPINFTTVGDSSFWFISRK